MLPLVSIGLVIAVFLLWRRLKAIEDRLLDLEAGASARDPWREGPAMEPVAQPAEVRPATIRVEPSPIVVEPPTPPAPVAEPRVEIEPGRSAKHEFERAPERPGFGFEDLFGRRLPIWAGGITLAIAGALIVRFSIEAGLFPPIVRVIGGLLFGLALIGGAEFAHRNTDRVRDPRVAQALSGAAIADLYASILIAANLYHLVPPLAAFLGMAAVTAAAMGLALRFGAASALLGLLGGLLAPVLVGSGEPDIPLLATYLALVAGGLCALSRRQRWAWLGIGALAGGFGWGGLLIIGGALHGIAALSTGLYVIALGMIFPLLAAQGPYPHLQKLTSGVIAALQIAALVATGGFMMLNWGLFGLVSIGIVWLAWRDERLAMLPPLGMAIAYGLLLAWPAPPAGGFTLVILATTMIYAGPALVRLWRGADRIVEAGQIAAAGGASLLLTLLHFHHADDGRGPLFGAIALLCAALPAGAAGLGWSIEGRRADARFALLAMSAAALIAAAGILALPDWSIPLWVAATGFGLLLLGHVAEDDRIEPGAWTLAGGSLLLLGLDHHLGDELRRAFGLDAELAFTRLAAIRWAGMTALFGAFAWRGRLPAAPSVAQVLAVLCAYGVAAQILPVVSLPLVPACGILLLAGWSRTLEADRLLPAMAAATALILAWALWPLALWAAPATASIVGIPMLMPLLPGVQDVLLRLLAPALALFASLTIARTGREPRAIGAAVGTVIGGVAFHILYKHVFHLADWGAFVRWGLVERSLWEALLLGVGILVWRFGRNLPQRKLVAIGLGIAALAHACFYSLLIHNPLWADQSVGGWPLLNGVILVYALPLLGLWRAPAFLPGGQPRLDPGLSIARMVTILLLGFSELRQLFHGAMLDAAGVTGPEDLLRSAVAIAFALGFLLWGIRQRQRPWRIGSLLLMLAAVGKVFLVDAADLDGLLRIFSFVALGFSLIGIGWLYNRHLRDQPERPVA
jgi:uncharacterized membrane protein